MKRDILWHNRDTNHIQVWSMDSTRIRGRAEIFDEHGQLAPVGLPWSIVGTGDFNGDGKVDILWHNHDTNHIQVWFMDGTRRVGRAEIVDEHGQLAPVGLPWSIVGTGDFNGDGKVDILWHNHDTNHIQVWFMDGTRRVGRAEIVDEHGQLAPVGLPWSIVGTGDFNGDGKVDILWHNHDTNHIQVWFMDGTRRVGRAEIVDEHGQLAPVGLPWSIVGTGDFNGDGKVDILWHNRDTNHIQVWFMDGTRRVGRAEIVDEHGQLAPVGLPWSIVGTGFFSSLPARLQFRLRGFTEYESTDDTFQGANDEVFMSAVGLDSAAVLVGPDGKPYTEPIEAGQIGDVSSDDVRGPWENNPYILIEFDLRRPSSWPRSFTVTLLIVEEDNENLAESIAKLRGEVGDEVKKAAVIASSAAAGALVGAKAGSVIPGIGTVVGTAVGAMAGAAYDFIIAAAALLGNEVFTPVTLVLEVGDPERIREHSYIGRPLSYDVQEHGAHYGIGYDWHLTQ
ncbi:MAG: VCBS repeat-containing protein [Anaerolineaceae bacterium]|nr:VCBS repeat-containing protein [Anaerolineaceae bacterium]